MTEARAGGVAVVMGAEELGVVMPGDLRERLGELTGRVVMVRAIQAGEGGEKIPVAGPEGLEDVEVLVTGWGCPPLTKDVLDRAPRLRVVVHAAGSVKRLVAAEEVWERGIVVSSAAGVNAGPVADFTLAVIALAAKGALPMAAAYANGRWPAFTERRGADGRTIGVIGASRTGRRVMTGLRASAAGYRVLLYDPYVTGEDAEQMGVERVSRLADLCRASDIVTVHAPATPETRGLLDEQHLALIPDGGTVINTARGSLVDTGALERECASGRLSAWLDVTDPEPLEKERQLLSLPNVMVTPHLAGAQGSEGRRLGVWAVKEVGRWVRGEKLLGEVRREELGRMA
ncbi:hydroxyacid dehydrogenase [Streptomyces roseoverticillatus]|uniref:hydroxyacid dehydrogenase n=1 Tax=Streptomyces roseoverticillatus TaxID=66429 RepID=UPI001F1A6312|nr:hydroxyacid dehydrogenase [Streptomyces roseoverticillatus]